jgi:ABC-type antimicrobial peptide transport system permease subunit
MLRQSGAYGRAAALSGASPGLAAGWAVTELMKSLLFGGPSTDLTTFALIALLLVGVILIASYVPSRRATKIDPLQALRHG